MNDMIKMNKMNEAALESVNGGTFNENVELAKAFKLDFGVNIPALAQHLYFKCGGRRRLV